MTSKRIDMMPLWTDAYLADTTHLTLEQHGAYMLLLQKAWRSGTADLPNQDVFFKNVLGITPKKWKTLRPHIEPFFTVQNDRWKHKRLSKEYSRAKRHSTKGESNGTTFDASKSRETYPSKPNEINGGDASYAGGEAVAVSGADIPSSTSSGRAGGIELVRRLEEVTGNAVDWQSENIALPKAIIGWMSGANAASLDEDILPTIKTICDRRRSRSEKQLRSWNYFQRAIFEARDLRLNPPANPTPQTPKAQHDRSNTNTPRHEQKTNSIIQSAIRSSSRVGGNTGHEIPEEWASPPTSRAESS